MKTLSRALPIFGVMFVCASANAEIISGIDFPQGAASFADSVFDFSPGSGPAAAFLDSANSLGVPDVNTSNGLSCYLAPSTSNCLFTSLGNGGTLALRFTDNVLTGSSASGSVTGVGDGFNDLYIVEVGVAEATDVEISADGSNWIPVGSIAGGGGSSIGVFTYGFDIDRLGYGFTDSFTYVRVKDVLTDQNTSPEGADIDAIGAIQTVVPLPAGAWLWPTGLVLMRWIRRRTARASI
jgi:hypothetical protein